MVHKIVHRPEFGLECAKKLWADRSDELLAAVNARRHRDPSPALATASPLVKQVNEIAD